MQFRWGLREIGMNGSGCTRNGQIEIWFDERKLAVEDWIENGELQFQLTSSLLFGELNISRYTFLLHLKRASDRFDDR